MSLIATIGEKPMGIKVKSGKQGKSADVTYCLRGYPGAFVAHDALKLLALDISVEMALAGLTLGEVDVEEIRIDQTTGLRDYAGTVTFTNGDNKEKEENDETISWSTTGGSEKIQQAIAQTGYTPDGSPVPAVGNSINVTADSVEGVEQPGQKLEFTIKHWWNPAVIDDDYIKFISDVSGKSNINYWRSFAPGELLFLGGEAQESSGTKPVPVSYKFAGSPNTENLEIIRPDGNNILVPFKKGWEYLWIMNEKRVDSAAQIVTMIPKAVFVAQTKHEFDFSGLGLRG